MSKYLLLIAAAGFGLCLVFFTLAFLIAGGQIFDGQKPLAAIKPLIDLATRKEWRWDGGDTLEVEGPMVVRYQAAGAPGVAVTGPSHLLKQVRVGDGQIDAGSGDTLLPGSDKLEAVVRGVPLHRFIARGHQKMQLGHIDQDSLYIRLEGHSSVSADGRVGQLNLVMTGHNDADLGALAARDVKLAILGHGDATLAPGHSIFVSMTGHGTVRLATHPAEIEKTIFGSGRIIEANAGARPLPPNPPQTNPPSVTPPIVPPPPLGVMATRNFVVAGSGIQQLGHFEQGNMNVTITGSGSASADGRIDKLAVMVAGSGDARLAGLSARQVTVTVAGSGDATIAPQDEARVTILGSGNVYLASRPRRIERNIMGSGRVIEQH